MQSRVAVFFSVFRIEPNHAEGQLTSVKLLMRNVQKPRKPRMTKPDNIHLISEMPEPAAYFAKERTRCEATKENVAFMLRNQHVAVVEKFTTHSEKHIYEPPRYSHRTPQMPGITCAVVVDLKLPAAEPLVQPPAIRAISHLHIREPFRDYGDERGVDSDTSTCKGRYHRTVETHVERRNLPTMVTTNHDCDATTTLRTCDINRHRVLGVLLDA